MQMPLIETNFSRCAKRSKQISTKRLGEEKCVYIGGNVKGGAVMHKKGRENLFH